MCKDLGSLPIPVPEPGVQVEKGNFTSPNGGNVVWEEFFPLGDGIRQDPSVVPI